ncbi:unnamed protein product [Aphanomyces euteiches]
MWYFESTGMAIATDEFGREHDYGYCFMESFKLPQCSQLDAFSIVRAKVSMRHIFRELPRICRSRAKTPRDAKKPHKEPKESKKIKTKIQPAKGTTTTTDAAAVKKSRGRPKKEDQVKNAARWNEEAVERMFQLRYKDFAGHFDHCKNTQTKKKASILLAAELWLQMEILYDATQVQNKVRPF